MKRLNSLYQLFADCFKKCNDDHVNAFGAMSAFFIILSIFPIMIFLLNMTRFLPYSKEDIVRILSQAISFNQTLIRNLVNEIYRKVGKTVSVISILTAFWSASSGVYSVILGLNSVYDIEETRNYFVLRFVSMFYTMIFVAMSTAMLIIWVFGNRLYDYICNMAPFFETIAGHFLHKRLFVTVIVLTLLFMITYQYVPNRKSKFIRQLPGALISTAGWVGISLFYSIFVDNMENFNYIYGSMAGVMLLFLWMYFCMCTLFVGAEINYFFENKRNYHKLVRTLRPNWNRQRRRKEQEIMGTEGSTRGRKNSPEFKKMVRDRVRESRGKKDK